jgi:hypothetical protein
MLKEFIPKIYLHLIYYDLAIVVRYFSIIPSLIWLLWIRRIDTNCLKEIWGGNIKKIKKLILDILVLKLDGLGSFFHKKSSILKCLFKLILPIISPTFFLADKYKRYNLNSKTQDNKKVQRITQLNTIYLIISIIFVVAISISRHNMILVLAMYYSFSRINEVFISFLIDAVDKMKYKPEGEEGLYYFDRLRLAFKSYIE